MKALFSAAAVGVCLTLAACTVHKTEAPSLAGPSDLALSLRMEANPDSIGLDGGSQSSVRVFANGPDGRPVAGLTIRVDMMVDGVAQDFGLLSARTIVTGSDGIARVIYTAPAAPQGGDVGTCNGLPGRCVEIVATPIGTNFDASNSGFGVNSVRIRLVPLGVIQPPAGTPTPCFTFSPGAPSANTPVQFTAGTAVTVGTSVVCQAPTADIVTFQWNFGDGTTGSGRQVTHTFTSGNTFQVTLTETNDRGVSASTTQPVNIGGAALPTARFTVSPSAPGVNQTVFFNASTSTPGAGHTISSYTWDFGDGTSARGVTATKAYSTVGTFTVTLTVADDAGQTATATQTVNVATSTGSAPTAQFTFSPAAPGVGETVFFNASTSSAGPGRTIASYSWTFGDGGTASGVTTTHAYTTAGTYSVQLRVTDDAGVSTTSPATTITVGSPPSPTAGFTYSPRSPVVGQQVIFDASSSTTAQGQTIQFVDWNFGDGTPVIRCPGGSSADCPGPTNRISTHTYQAIGTFVVNLVVTDSAGRTGSTNQQIAISDPNPVAVLNLFRAGGNSITADGSQSTPRGTATIVSYRFIWGDGTPDTAGSSNSASHTYLLPGNHTVTLIVTDSGGRTGSTSRDITTP